MARIFFGVNALETIARWMVCKRWVLVDEDPRRHDGVGHHHLKDVALGGAEIDRIFQGGINIGVAADAPEVVAFVE